MCRFNATAPLPSIPGGTVPLDGFDDAFNWFDAIDAIELEEKAACEPTAPYQQDVKFEEPTGAGLDLVGWFQQQVCPEWTGVSVLAPAGVGSAASTDVAETAMKLEEYVVEGPTAVEGAVLTSSCSVGEPAGEDQPMSNDSSASPSMQKMNNTAGMDRPVRQCHASRHRVPRINYSEVDDKVERVKQKRRESAQRSRARKNAYMQELEAENAALRAQVAQLQQIANQLQGIQYMATVPANEQLSMV